MAPNSTPSFEDVEKHVQALDLDAFKPGGRHHLPAASAAGVPANFCAAYKAIKPILQLVAATPLIPPKWRTAIQAFITVMDAVCP